MHNWQITSLKEKNQNPPHKKNLKLAGCYSLFVRKASVCNQQYKSKAIVKQEQIHFFLLFLPVPTESEVVTKISWFFQLNSVLSYSAMFLNIEALFQHKLQIRLETNQQTKPHHFEFCSLQLYFYLCSI